MAQERFKSRGGFILACVGAAVGLGDSLRFPGFCAKYGGGAFLLIYFVGLILIGIPVLNAEIALGRKFRAGAPKCMASLNKKAEPLGWASCFNSLIVALLYAGILAWIIAMVIKIVPLCRSSSSLTHAETGSYFFDKVLSPTGISPIVLVCIVVAWGLMYFCLRGGAGSLAKTAKFTVLIPIVLLTFLAVRGLLYENSGEALYALFVPDFSAFGDAELWLNAIGQVFFSLSVLVGIMPAYGAYLPEKTNVFRDSMIIAFTDFFISVLSSVVLFTTLYGCGMQGDISQSGIVTAFMVYPAAITVVFGAGNTVANSVVGVLFYLSLAMMATQSSVSMVEAAANPLAEKFNLNKKKLVGVICIIGAAISIIFATPDVFPRYRRPFRKLLQYFTARRCGMLPSRQIREARQPRGGNKFVYQKIQNAAKTARFFAEVSKPRGAFRAVFMGNLSPYLCRKNALRRLSRLGAGGFRLAGQFNSVRFGIYNLRDSKA